MATFPKRVGKNGKVSWQAKVRLNGVNRSKTFVKKSDAVAWATSVENTINEGKPVQQRKQLQKTLSDIFDDYLDSGLVTDKKERLLRRLAVEIGALKLEDLNTKRLALYLQLKSEQAIPAQARKKVDHPLYEGGKKIVGGEVVAKTYKPASIRHYYYALRTALLWHAKVNDYHFNDKPFRDNPPPPAWKEPRERRLEDGELVLVLGSQTSAHNQVGLAAAHGLFEVEHRVGGLACQSFDGATQQVPHTSRDKGLGVERFTIALTTYQLVKLFDLVADINA